MAKAKAPVVKYHLGTGRRKTSVARVRVCDGNGSIEINGRPHDTYFPLVKDQRSVLAPLQETDLVGKVNVYVKVHGGGFTGQSGAVCQGLARALKVRFTEAEPVQAVQADAEEGEEAGPTVPPMVKKLRDSGLLTRDSRMKERKKYGHKGARKSFQFSKR